MGEYELGEQLREADEEIERLKAENAALQKAVVQMKAAKDKTVQIAERDALVSADFVPF
jgi:hypothetical protein